MGRMLFGLLPAMLACTATRATDPSPATALDVPPATATMPGLEATMKQASVEQQHADVLYKKRMDQARRYHKGLEYTRALEAVEHALLLRPAGREALALESMLQEQLGIRGGSVRTQMDDLYAGEQLRRQMERIQMRKKLDLAAEASERGDFDRAKDLLEDALFIVTTSRYQNDALAKLRDTARAELKKLEATAARRRAEQDERNLEIALKRIEEQDG